MIVYNYDKSKTKVTLAKQKKLYSRLRVETRVLILKKFKLTKKYFIFIPKGKAELWYAPSLLR
jgi:hypothetical protein